MGIRMQAEARLPAAISSLPPAVPEFHTRPAPQCLGVLAGHAPRARRAAAGAAAQAAGGAKPGGTWPRSAPRPPTWPWKPACLRCRGVWGRQAVGEMSQRCTSEYASPSGRSVSGRQPSGHAFSSYPCTSPPHPPARPAASLRSAPPQCPCSCSQGRQRCSLEEAAAKQMRCRPAAGHAAVCQPFAFPAPPWQTVMHTPLPGCTCGAPVHVLVFQALESGQRGGRLVALWQV